MALDGLANRSLLSLPSSEAQKTAVFEVEVSAWFAAR